MQKKLSLLLCEKLGQPKVAARAEVGRKVVLGETIQICRKLKKEN